MRYFICALSFTFSFVKSFLLALIVIKWFVAIASIYDGFDNGSIKDQIIIALIALALTYVVNWIFEDKKSGN